MRSHSKSTLLFFFVFSIYAVAQGAIEELNSQFTTGLDETIFWMNRASYGLPTQNTFKIYNYISSYLDLPRAGFVISATIILCMLFLALFLRSAWGESTKLQLLSTLSPPILIFALSPGRTQFTLIFSILYLSTFYRATHVGWMRSIPTLLFSALFLFCLYLIHDGTAILLVFFSGFLVIDRNFGNRIRFGEFSPRIVRLFSNTAAAFFLIYFLLGGREDSNITEFSTQSSSGLTWIITCVVFLFYILALTHKHLIFDPRPLFLIIFCCVALVIFKEFNFSHLSRTVLLPAWIAELLYFSEFHRRTPLKLT